MIAKLLRKEDPCIQDAGGFLPRQDWPTTKYQIARTRQELYSAFGLVYDTYLRSNLTSPNRHRKRVSKFHSLETTDVFVAMELGKVVCTLSLFGDSERGIPMDALYPDAINRKRARGKRIAELGALAQRDVGNLSVLLRLIQLLTQRADYRGYDEGFIAVHPRHVKFYQKFLAFEPFGPCQFYHAVCGQPAVGMILRLRELRNEQAFKRLYGQPFPQRQLSVGPLARELRDEIRDLASEIIDNGTSDANGRKTELAPAA